MPLSKKPPSSIRDIWQQIANPPGPTMHQSLPVSSPQGPIPAQAERREVEKKQCHRAYKWDDVDSAAQKSCRSVFTQSDLDRFGASRSRLQDVKSKGPKSCIDAVVPNLRRC
jgi:hypothetical protein